MTRLIDADAVWERYDKEYRQQNIYDGAQDKDWLERCINEAPTVDAEPVRHGKWIDVSEPDGNDNVQCRCSECSAGDTHSKSMVVPYCWRCGTKMDGE